MESLWFDDGHKIAVYDRDDESQISGVSATGIESFLQTVSSTAIDPLTGNRSDSGELFLVERWLIETYTEIRGKMFWFDWRTEHV